MTSEDSMRKREVRTVGESKAASGTAVAGELAPQWLKPYAEQVGPLLSKLGNLVDQMTPWLVKMSASFENARLAVNDHHPELLARMALGLLLMFFGGSFVTTIACFEAVRMAGWTQISTAVTSLWEDYKKVKAASDKDDSRDDDNDGIADVQQISKQQLISRKMQLAFVSCDPKEVTVALNGLYASSICVLATLRSKFARVVTLGATIGEVLTPFIVKLLHAPLTAVFPKEYHKWIDVVLGYLCRMVGVSVAWIFQRMVSAVHSSMRGAKMFTDAFAEFTALKGYKELSVGYVDEAIATVCVLCGLSMQMSSWFSLPWLLWIPLLPVVILETFLAYLVGMA
eukprot:gb/GEZN01006541.1/.p1 GENE.gb/GEZN01006541.1/~~gb/GEZN01006541.1/.p1  ORF type:complete len:341 (+),score=36.66 gb/GEZN01006541.1/:161-1183(+)